MIDPKKLKVALVYHIGQLYGGHVSYSNYLVKGLRQIGCDVQFILLSHKKTVNKRWKGVQGYLKKNNGINDKVKTPLHYTWYQDLNCYGHLIGGFIRETFHYRNDEQFQIVKQKLDSKDLIIWQDIGNFNQQDLRNCGNTNWLKLFKRDNPNTKQIACVHDGNIFQRYPFLHAIREHIDQIVGVHPASYNLGSGYGIPTSLIVNPQDLSRVDQSDNGYKNKDKKSMITIGTWKASKRFQELLAAVPWIDNEARIKIIGQGIQKSYIITQNKDKVKKQYVASQKTDPDILSHPMPLTGDVLEDGILRRAQRWNKNFGLYTVITQQERQREFDTTFLCIEPAWYRVNFKIDAHFSRVLVQAMMRGILPVARNLGLSNNEQGDGTFFKANQNYIMIPYDATNKEFGQIINETLNISEQDYERIVNNNYKLLGEFCYKQVARRFVEVGFGDYSNIKYFNHTTDQDKIQKLADKSKWILTQKTPKTFHIEQDKLQELIDGGYIKL